SRKFYNTVAAHCDCTPARNCAQIAEGLRVMKIGRLALMTGVAAVAMAATGALAQDTKADAKSDTVRPNLVVAQNAQSNPQYRGTADLAARVQALEDAQQ